MTTTTGIAAFHATHPPERFKGQVNCHLARSAPIRSDNLTNLHPKEADFSFEPFGLQTVPCLDVSTPTLSQMHTRIHLRGTHQSSDPKVAAVGTSSNVLQKCPTTL